MNTKFTSVILMAIVVLSFSSCDGQPSGCCSVDKSKTSCSNKCSISKKMTKENEACSKCSKNSSDTSCTSNPEKDRTLEGQRLKTLIPSCSLSEATIINRKSELNQRGIFLKVQTVKELSDGYDFIFNEPKEFSQEILDYINFERSCCSDFSFAIEFEPNFGAIHLKIFGSKAIKRQMKNAIKELKINNK